jgi:hypothetical protein
MSNPAPMVRRATNAVVTAKKTYMAEKASMPG